MRRIVIHWTAGKYTPNILDRLHYHYLIDGDGLVIPAVPVIRNEEPLKLGYAAHTRRCNSGSIGIALCCAWGAIPQNLGAYPPLPVQLVACAQLVAKLCKRHDIPLDREHVLTHGEVEVTLGIKQRGKWDLLVLPGIATTGGNYLRREAKRWL